MKNTFIAHRGNNIINCENRLEIIKEVLNIDYISGIEVDIRKTFDNKFILSHNQFLKSDKLVNINKSKLKNLLKMNFYINNKIFKIHTLEELLNINTNKIILLEIKDNININILNKILKKFTYLNLYICSFNYNFISSFKKKYPNYKCGLIIGYLMNLNKNFDIFDFLMFHHSSILNTNKPYFVWTVNNIKIFNKFKNNILGCITDNAYKFKKK